MRRRQIVLVRIGLLRGFSTRIVPKKGLVAALGTDPACRTEILFNGVPERGNLAGSGGLLGEQLAAILQQAFDVRFDRRQASGFRLLSLTGLLTQEPQLTLQ